MIRSAASSASVPVVRNTTRSVRFGQTDRSFSAASIRWTLLPALVQHATPCSPHRRIHDLDDLGMAVADVVRAPAGAEVDEAVPVHVFDQRALGALAR